MIEAVTLVNTATGDKIEINMDDGPYYTEEIDWGSIESSNQSYKYVDQIGMHITGTTLETRRVSITGWIANEKEYEVQKLKRALNRFVNPKQMIEIYYGKYKLSLNPKNSVIYSAMYKDNNDVMCRFLILGLCSDPLFSLSEDLAVIGTNIKPNFMFPWVIPEDGYIMGMKDPAKSMKVTNNGDIETGMIIEFVSQGIVVNPYIINLATQEQIKINKTLLSDEMVRINTNHGKKKVEGIIRNQSFNYYKYRDLNSAWLMLPVGETSFVYGADENVDSLETHIIYSDKYLEVQT